MPKLVLSILFILLFTIARSQTIATTLHLNEQKEFKTVQPKKIEETEAVYTADGKKVEKRIKTLDSYGMLLTDERFDKDDSPIATITFTNNAEKKLVLKRTFERLDQTEDSKEINLFNYDANNLLISILSQNENGKIKQRCDLVNDKKGHPVELTIYNVFGNATQKETAIYNYDKNIAITTLRSTEGKVLSTDTIKISIKDAHLFADKDCTYNEKGDPIRWIATNPDGLKTIFEEEYKYDKAGNCTYADLYATTINADGKRDKKEQWEIKRKYTYDPAKKAARGK